MNLHEYQAKYLMREYGIPTMKGVVCYTPKEAQFAYDLLKSDVCAVKAQIHAGGRGKAGGVKLVRSAHEARAAANEILGMRLITPQTGEKGKIVKKVYVEAGCNIDREFYFSMLIDRSSAQIAVVVSPEGGMEIEEVASKEPDKILSISIDPNAGMRSFLAQEISAFLGIEPALARSFAEQVLFPSYNLFVGKDLTLLEINPLVLTKDRHFVALDAKCSADDNALYRQNTLVHFKDYDEEDDRELEAKRINLSYVALDGDIGCMVNGAGLAMATMDIIKAFGGNPANFLDVGGGADKDKVKQAFKIILSDEKVKAILVNIFGGIMKCDVIAQGIVDATNDLNISVPVVVRLQGTNVDLGRKILAESGLKIIPAETMEEAAKKVTEAVK